METTKVFNNGRSQTVRIPKRFRFSVPEVMIRREGNSIILTPMSQQDALKAFLALPCCPDFELNRENAQKIQKRKDFV